LTQRRALDALAVPHGTQRGNQLEAVVPFDCARNPLGVVTSIFIDRAPRDVSHRALPVSDTLGLARPALASETAPKGCSHGGGAASESGGIGGVLRISRHPAEPAERGERAGEHHKCRDWHANGLGTVKAIEIATSEYRTDQDVLGLWIADCAKVGGGRWCATSVLYESYLTWCKSEQIDHPTAGRDPNLDRDRRFVELHEAIARLYLELVSGKERGQ
jgi:hypothetical protein